MERHLGDTLANATEFDRGTEVRSSFPVVLLPASNVAVELPARQAVTRQQTGSGALVWFAGLLDGEGQHGEQERLEASGKHDSRTPPNWSIAAARVI